MRNVADLIKKAHELKEKGFTTGEIADELNISRETALWLVTHGTEMKEKEKMPKDIYIDWSTIGAKPLILKNLSLAMTELVRGIIRDNKLVNPDVIAGIAVSGIPLATVIAAEMGASLAVVRPKKHQWEPEKPSKQEGIILSNFSDVKGKNVVIVDDIATTGSTLKDTKELLESLGATPIAAALIIDKKGIEMIGKMPVKALISVGLVE